MMQFTLFNTALVKITKGERKSPNWSKNTEVNTYGVYIAKLKGNETLEFTFYDSQHNTYSGEARIREDLVYDILYCISSDYYVDLEDTEVMGGFDFANLTPYEARAQLDNLIEIVEGLHKIFKDTQIEQLSENDDQLKDFIKMLEIKRG